MAPSSAARGAALLASICAGGVIAEQVGGKATRDALFLSSFGISALPAMLMVSALLSLVIVSLGGRAMSALGPPRLVPLAFFGSAAMLVVGSALVGQLPRVVAIAMYLHVGSLGSVLVSWFWSLINERFDPHTAKRYVSQIAGGAAVGGLAGGLLAERLAKPLGVGGMLPVLAGLHVGCGGLTLLLRPGARDRSAAPSAYVPPPTNASPRIVEKAGLSSFRHSSYVRDLALLMSLGAVGASLLDYALKAEAASSLGRGAPLLRFFGIYYTATAVGSLLVQLGLSRRMLERFGLARTVGTLPLTLSAGGIAALVAPRLWCLAIARGAESAVRNSLFRSGYELFYTPMQSAEKRAVKTFIDVGGERVGDLVGGGMVTLFLATVPEIASTTVMIGAVAFGCVGLPVVRRLQRGYVTTLERSLLDRGTVVELGSSLDQTTRSVILHTRPDVSFADLTAVGSVPALPSPPPSPRSCDPAAERAAALRSGDRPRVEEALRDGPLTPELVPAAIDLLGWNEVAPEAMDALRRVATSVVGALADTLLDPSTEFAIRRRLPRVLAGATTPRAVEALLSGLDDQRFEVRYQCGRALGRIREVFPESHVPVERVHSVVMREVAIDRGVWENQRLLDRSDEATESPFVDRFLRDRASRSLEHVFTLLSFTLPMQPLIIAFRGLHTTDDTLRGTALEYLELVLPEAIRASLWPFIEEERMPRVPSRPRAEILAALMESHASIELNLKLLRRDA